MNETMFSVSLKQHTPIIHFQPHQRGATLRASEIKPLINKHLEKKYHNKYQIKVKLGNEIDPDKPNSNLLYFGDTGETNENKKKKTFYDQKITLYINTYFDVELRDEITKALSIVLALNNFGTRRNKGTGCYFIEGKSIDDFENILRNEICNRGNKVYYWDWNDFKDIGEVFLSIKLFYNLLKSGITLKSSMDKKVRTDYPSLLCKYFLSLSEPVTWEREKIKKTWRIGHVTKAEQPLHALYNYNYRFIRALFGTGDTQLWKQGIGIPSDVNVTVRFPTAPEKFDRIPSTINFKVFIQKNNSNARVYFWSTDSYKKVLDKKFSFSAYGEAPIPIESPKEFDIHKFFDFVVSEISKLSVNNNTGRDLLQKK